MRALSNVKIINHAQRMWDWSGSRLHDTRSSLSEPASDVLEGYFSQGLADRAVEMILGTRPEGPHGSPPFGDPALTNRAPSECEPRQAVGAFTPSLRPSSPPWSLCPLW